MKFGAYHRDRGWITDTGVGGTYSWNVQDAQWNDSVEAWRTELIGTDIVEGTDFQDDPITIGLLEQCGWMFPRLL